MVGMRRETGTVVLYSLFSKKSAIRQAGDDSQRVKSGEGDRRLRKKIPKSRRDGLMVEWTKAVEVIASSVRSGLFAGIPSHP
jgi:hypothetical protein